MLLLVVVGCSSRTRPEPGTVADGATVLDVDSHSDGGREADAGRPPDMECDAGCPVDAGCLDDSQCGPNEYCDFTVTACPCSELIWTVNPGRCLTNCASVVPPTCAIGSACSIGEDCAPQGICMTTPAPGVAISCTSEQPCDGGRCVFLPCPGPPPDCPTACPFVGVPHSCQSVCACAGNTCSVPN
jgi:hypothetical protein